MSRAEPTLMPIRSRAVNPYLDLLYRHLRESGVNVLDDQRFFRARLLGRTKIDFVHSHWPEHQYGHVSRAMMPHRSAYFFTRIAAMRRAGARVIFTLHNTLPHENSWPEFHRWARRRMIAMSDLVLVNFESARAHLADVYGRTKGVHCVPHGSYRTYYPDTITRSEARRALGLAEDAFVFLAFGEVRPYKNTLGLIEAFARVTAPNARLLVAGRARDPAHGREVSGAAARDGRVMFRHDIIPDRDVQTFFRAADVLLLARDTFSSGTAVLALDFDLPLVAPRQNHVAEIALGESLVDLDPTNASSIADAMERAMATDLGRARADARRSSLALAWPPIGERFATILRGDT